jgi:4-diphosphocytidyl-2-C-methyl-D-erythritol kinase
VTAAPAYAKLNLALVVGPRRPDGLHEVATVIQRIGVADRVALDPATHVEVTGFPEDTLVSAALASLQAARPGSGWSARIEKEIPVAAGLGGGSSDAATALRLANDTLDHPLNAAELHELAASLGADVPFYLTPGPKLAREAGTELSPLELPQDYAVLVLLPHDAEKSSTGAVYEAFDARGGERGFEERLASLLRALEQIAHPRDLAALPGNDLAAAPLANELERAGAFRAGVTGAGPALYGLFDERSAAAAAADHLSGLGATWVTEPAW